MGRVQLRILNLQKGLHTTKALGNPSECISEVHIVSVLQLLLNCPRSYRLRTFPCASS